MICIRRSWAAAALAAAVFVCSALGADADSTPAPATPAAGPPPLPAMIQWHTTESGVKYAEVKVGTGNTPTDGQIAVLHFIGWTESDGKQFDNSRERSNKPFGFKLGAGQVIRGWEEGVRGMRVGGVRRLIVPGELGYGSRGVPGRIAPDATLIFDIELVGIATK